MTGLCPTLVVREYAIGGRRPRIRSTAALRREPDPQDGAGERRTLLNSSALCGKRHDGFRVPQQDQ